MSYRSVDYIPAAMRRAMTGVPGGEVYYSVDRSVAPAWALQGDYVRPILATVRAFETSGNPSLDLSPTIFYRAYIKRPKSMENRHFGSLGSALGYVERQLIALGVPDGQWTRTATGAGAVARSVEASEGGQR